MKDKRLASFVFTVIILLITMLFSVSGPRSALPDYSYAEPPPFEELLPSGKRWDDLVMINVLVGGETVEMSIERYLIGVTAAEMPASFEHEALKAQAVTARTSVAYNMQVAPKTRHPDCQVCTDHTCCMAFSSDEQLRVRWGRDYVVFVTRIIMAVVDTDGVILVNDDLPLLAVFHSSSAGKTESSGNVWLQDLPYLQSVFSPETAENVPGYVSSLTVPLQVFTDTFTEDHPEADFSSSVDSWVTDITYTSSGRVDEVTIGGVRVKATRLRAVFGLRSTAVTFRLTANDVIFTTTGYGHGVGMSQYGANTMALGGKGYKDILSAYYTGCSFASTK